MHKKNKSSFAKFQEFVEKEVAKIQEVTKTTEYDITFVVKKHDQTFEDNGTVYHTHASIEVDDRYLAIKLNLFPAMVEEFNEKNYNWIRKVLTHEIAHVKSNALKALCLNRHVTEEQIIHEDERLAEFIGRTIYDTMYSNEGPRPVKRNRKS